jgi:exopolyphosphatase/pppGpp-phosphohydrolase
MNVVPAIKHPDPFADNWSGHPMVGILLSNRTSNASAPRVGHRDHPRLLGRLGCSPHERRVAHIAVRLFDLLAARHRLGPRYRALLQTGALVHDAARCYGAADHHVRGAQLVFRDRELALTARARRAVAYLVRYHRGDVDDVEGILRPGDGRRKLRILLGLLRVADALDSRHAAAEAIVIRHKGRKVRIQCLVDEEVDDARRRFTRPDKFKLLEKALGLRVQVRVRRSLP